MSTGVAIFLAAATLLTAIVSGVFGMAGGLILLGILLAVLDVAPAMVLLGLTQLASNGWRALIWRANVHWRLLGGFTVGALLAFAVMRFLAILPSKGFVYLLIGVLPFAIEVLPRRLVPDISRAGAPLACGIVITALQMVGGTAGNVLSAFFQASRLNRKEIVATKATMQLLGHMLRIVYFGSLTGIGVLQAPLVLIATMMAMAVLGTTLGGLVLARMSDDSFRTWSLWVIRAVSLIYVLRGLFLLATVSPT